LNSSFINTAPKTVGTPLGADLKAKSNGRCYSGQLC